MLDTNTASYLVSGRSLAARQRYAATVRHAKVFISSLTEAEIRYGLEKKPGATKVRAETELFLALVTVLAWDSQEAAAYARLRNTMRIADKALATMDILIASHAIAAGAILVSHDKAFQQLTPWLQVVDWATDL